MSRRIPVHLVTLSLLVGILLGSCATSQCASVSFWTQYSTNATLRAVLDDFSRETGVAVDLKRIDFGTDAIFVAIAGGALPDLFTHGAAALGAFAAQGILSPLEPIMAKWSFTKDMIPAVREAGLYEGKQLVTAWNGIAVRDLAYDAAIWAEVGLDARQPPQDWDSLVSAGRKLVKRDSNGSLTRNAFSVSKSGSGLQQWWSLFHHQTGGNLLVSGRPRLNDGTAVEALQFYVDLIHTYRLDDLGFSGTMSKNTSAMSWTSWGNIKPLLDKGRDIGMMTFPYKVRPASFLAIDWAAITTSARNPVEAGHLLGYLLHPDQQKRLNQAVGGAVPFYRSAQQWDWVKTSPQLLHLFQATSYGVPNPSHPLWFEIRDVLVSSIGPTLKLEITPNAAMEQAQAAIMHLVTTEVTP